MKCPGKSFYLYFIKRPEKLKLMSIDDESFLKEEIDINNLQKSKNNLLPKINVKNTNTSKNNKNKENNIINNEIRNENINIDEQNNITKEF